MSSFHKLVDRHAVAVCHRCCLHVGPAQRHRPAVHGLAAEFFLVIVHHASIVMHFARCQHGVGMDHDAAKVVVPVQPQPEHREAGLGRNGQRHFVGHLQALGAAELLATQKLHAQQPQLLQVGCITLGQKGVARQRGVPQRLRYGRAGGARAQAGDEAMPPVSQR